MDIDWIRLATVVRNELREQLGDLRPRNVDALVRVQLDPNAQDHFDVRFDEVEAKLDDLAEGESAGRGAMSDWVWLHQTLERIEGKLNRITSKENEIMALQQDVEAAITRNTTAVEGVITYVNGLVANGIIDQAAGQKMIDDLNANSARLETAFTTNVA